MRTKMVLLAAAATLAAILACSGQIENMQIETPPRYVCPSATPRPTDTPFPTSTATYPAYFRVNLQSRYFSGTRIALQLTMQNAGRIELSYAGARSTYPYTWYGTRSRFRWIATSHRNPSTITYLLTIPTDVYRVDITMQASNVPGYQRLTAYRASIPTTPQPRPCCAPPPRYPTAVPTYTPYPTPTPYVLENDYFIGDIVYSNAQASGLRVGFRLLDITTIDTSTLSETGEPQAIHIWTLQITNVGDIAYSLFPPAQSYVAVVRGAGGDVSGVWGPSLTAAEEAGLSFTDMTWDPQDIPPGATETFVLAAYGPRGVVQKINYAMDATQRDAGAGTPNPTTVPGSNIVSWVNAINTDCSGDIAVPD